MCGQNRCKHTEWTIRITSKTTNKKYILLLKAKVHHCADSVIIIIKTG